MEVLAIQNLAVRQQLQAVEARDKLQALQQQTERLKIRERKHRIRSVASLFVSSIGDGLVAVAGGIQVFNEYRAVQNIHSTLYSQKIEMRSAEHRAFVAAEKARTLMSLARRAIGGNVYAKHQANYVAGLEGTIM